jgi:hypothetical protein
LYWPVWPNIPIHTMRKTEVEIILHACHNLLILIKCAT